MNANEIIFYSDFFCNIDISNEINAIFIVLNWNFQFNGNEKDKIRVMISEL